MGQKSHVQDREQRHLPSLSPRLSRGAVSLLLVYACGQATLVISYPIQPGKKNNTVQGFCFLCLELQPLSVCLLSRCQVCDVFSCHSASLEQYLYGIILYTVLQQWNDIPVVYSHCAVRSPPFCQTLPLEFCLQLKKAACEQSLPPTPSKDDQREPDFSYSLLLLSLEQ